MSSYTDDRPHGSHPWAQVMALLVAASTWCSQPWEHGEWFGRRQAWRGLMEAAFATFAIGGVLVVPVTTALAIVGSLVPGHTPLHQLGGLFYSYGALWFIFVLCGAQLKRSRSGKEPVR